MKILIYAPSVGLEAVAELVACMDGHQAETLSGLLGSREALSRLADSGADILHVITHGSQQEILLTDGPLDATFLAIAASSSRVPRLKLFFGNYCNSTWAAAKMSEAGVGFAIGWGTNVDNAVAVEFAKIFYRVFSLSGGDIRVSFRTAADFIRRSYPHHTEPILLNSGRSAPWWQRDAVHMWAIAGLTVWVLVLTLILLFGG